MVSLPDGEIRDVSAGTVSGRTGGCDGSGAAPRREFAVALIAAHREIIARDLASALKIRAPYMHLEAALRTATTDLMRAEAGK